MLDIINASRDNWQMVLAGAAGIAAVGWFVRTYPKEKLWNMVKPFIKIGATATDAMLLRWLPKKVAEKVEEGVICTLLYVAKQSVSYFEDILLSNNKKKLEK